MFESVEHDFRKPAQLRSHDEQQLFEWMRAACSVLTNICERHFPFHIRSTIESIKTTRWTNFAGSLDASSIGFRVGFVQGDEETLLTLRRPLAKLIAAGLLGDTPTTHPEDSELTPTTTNLLKLFIEYFTQAVRETWPQNEPGLVELRSEELSLKRQQLFSATEPIVIAKFQFELATGIEELQWFIPAETVRRFFATFNSSDRANQSQRERQSLQGLIGEMPTRVTVRLGTIELTAAQFKALRVGDVLVLDQKVDDPLTVAVGDEDTYLGWPGRVGIRQALQIESLVKG